MPTPELLDRCAFPAAGVAAVSGGADSTALLVLAVEAGCDVTAVHVATDPDKADEKKALDQLHGYGNQGTGKDATPTEKGEGQAVSPQLPAPGRFSATAGSRCAPKP